MSLRRIQDLQAQRVLQTPQFELFQRSIRVKIHSRDGHGEIHTCAEKGEDEMHIGWAGEGLSDEPPKEWYVEDAKDNCSSHGMDAKRFGIVDVIGIGH